MHVVPSQPFERAPPAMVRRDANAMYDDFLNHMVLAIARGDIAHREYSCAYNYVHWYFRVSHPYITPDAGRATQTNSLGDI